MTFQPPDSTTPVTVSAPVDVSSSGFQLGTSNGRFDDLILGFADLRGIPPQILKAQIQRESGFNPNSYRYEPLSQDFAEVSAGKNLRVDPRFAPWRLAAFEDFVNPDPAGLPQCVIIDSLLASVDRQIGGGSNVRWAQDPPDTSRSL